MLEINGRDDGKTLVRFPVYRAKVPLAWTKIPPPAYESIADTTRAIYEFRIEDSGDVIRITVHNFPTENMGERILPIIQIGRWKRQFDFIDPARSSVYSLSRGGFGGVGIDAFGLMKGEDKAILGWSMQIDSDHYRRLMIPSPHARQMRADYTIKAVGSPSLMQKYKDEILDFANSFELIQEVPSSP